MVEPFRTAISVDSGGDGQTAIDIKLAETGGFEPPIRCDPYNGLANRRLQPLGHVSGNATSVSATPSTVKDLKGPQWSSGPRPSSALARFLIEQNRAHVRVFHIDVKGRFHLDGQTAFDRRTRQQGLEPTPDVWKAAQVVAVALGPARPTDVSDVGDRISAGEKFAVLKTRGHDAVDSGHLAAEALDGVWQLLGRIVSEVVRLPCLGAEIGHLPEQPLVDLDAAALVTWIEFSSLAAEVLQDRAGLKDRDRPAVGAGP